MDHLQLIAYETSKWTVTYVMPNQAVIWWQSGGQEQRSETKRFAFDKPQCCKAVWVGPPILLQYMGSL
jgi:hypothetical protein